MLGHGAMGAASNRMGSGNGDAGGGAAGSFRQVTTGSPSPHNQMPVNQPADGAAAAHAHAAHCRPSSANGSAAPAHTGGSARRPASPPAAGGGLGGGDAGSHGVVPRPAQAAPHGKLLVSFGDELEDHVGNGAAEASRHSGLAGSTALRFQQEATGQRLTIPTRVVTSAMPAGVALPAGFNQPRLPAQQLGWGAAAGGALVLGGSREETFRLGGPSHGAARSASGDVVRAPSGALGAQPSCDDNASPPSTSGRAHALLGRVAFGLASVSLLCLAIAARGMWAGWWCRASSARRVARADPTAHHGVRLGMHVHTSVVQMVEHVSLRRRPPVAADGPHLPARFWWLP